MKKTILLISFVLIICMPGFSAKHVITNTGATFSPDSITINILDTVEFSLANFHNAVEVSKATYESGDTTSNGGFRLPFGGGKVAFHTLGVHYYVCQPHAAIGMKGVINVVATRGTHVITNNLDFQFVPESIQVEIGDTVYFSLLKFHDAVEVSETTFDANDTTSNGGFRLPFGGGYVVMHDTGEFYYVCQPHVAEHGMKGEILVTAPPRTHIITNNLDFQFVPDSIHIEVGDTVYFSLLKFHNAVEVSKAIYDADGTESNGGFNLPFGGGMVAFAEAGVHYYVCQPHVASHGMKGRIYVGAIPTDVPSVSPGSVDFNVYPVPATDNIRMSFTLKKQAYVTINMIDITGKVVANILSESQNSGTHEKVYPFDQSIKPGVYFLRIQLDIGNPAVKQIIVQ
jgi:plastocyanin